MGSGKCAEGPIRQPKLAASVWHNLTTARRRTTLHGMHDVLITGGTLIDGTGATRRAGNLAIDGDRISAIDNTGNAAHLALDATGLIVCPGFVDVHNHSEGWLLKRGHLTEKTLQGFTSEVLFSDGISYAPVGDETWADWIYYLYSLNGLELADYHGWHSIRDYLELLDRHAAQNVIAQIPYANIRTLAAGWGRQRPDDTQIRQMQYHVAQAMEQGAVGVSSGLDYIVQCFAETDELAEVCRAMAPHHGLYVTHIRYKKGLLPALEEAVQIGRQAGVAVHISHLKGETPEEIELVLEFLDGAAQQVDLSFDVYPYLPGCTMLNSLLPYEAWEDGPLAVLSKLRSSALRRRFNVQLADYRNSLDEITIAWAGGRAERDLRGKSLGEYVEQTGSSPGDALADLLIDCNLGVLCVFDRGDDVLVEPMLKHPQYMLGSDGIWQPAGRVHPRQFGSVPRMLGPLVRDRKLFTLEEAVRKLSAWPAERFGLKDRGVLRSGAFADVVVFDPATIADRATFDDPQQPGVGIRHVLVNGTPVVKNGEPQKIGEPGPGRALSYRR